ncbi:MAG TPA: SpoIVB peptidase S55 domain-containing protein [Thermoanaerobaculia bacterium]|nr:SpoIVB peptidase S55 domain-containing protein [Thermoanaerobaculia bacterium]
MRNRSSRRLFHRRPPACLGLLLSALLVPAAFAGQTGNEAVPKEAQVPPIPAPTHPIERQGPDPLPIISVDEVKTGQRGYGLSVFAGKEPERFEVEVVGVVRNQYGPGLSHILARLTGKGLEVSGVANGMSGSPVFIDGRLAGAVAFSWPFSHEAIAGITPIESMRQLSGLVGMPPTSPIPPVPPVPLADILAGKIPSDLLEREMARLRPRMGNDAVASLQWVTSGFGEMSQGILQRALGSASSAGEARPGDTEKDLKPGSAVAAVLVDGDFRLAATGTVTDRYGDQVLAFGHPFLGLGPIKVPMASSEVVTVLSNQYASFKISNLGQEIGAFEQDRKAGIQGRMGQKAPTIPMVVRISGGGNEKPREFHMRLAEVPFFTNMFVGSTVVASLESAIYTSGRQGLDVKARFGLEKYGDLVMEQSFDGDSAVGEVAAFLLAVSAYLTQNPLEQVRFESIEVDVTQSPLPRAATLVGAHAQRTVVRPGDRVGINLDLAAYEGPRFRRAFSIDLPDDLPAGRYSLMIGDGYSVDAVRLALEPVEPVTFAQALELLGSFHSRRNLVVLGVYGGPGLSVAGEVMPRLPGSVRSLWSAAASGSATALRTTIAQTHEETMPFPVAGLVRVDLEVRRRDPVSGSGGEPEKPQGEGAANAAVISPEGQP